MLPVMLNLETLKIALIGEGEKLRAREAKLFELGAKHLTVMNASFSHIEFHNFDVVMIVGLPEDIFTNLHSAAKAAGCLVNVEDKKEYCDFFFQSFVKRGGLLISVSTSGKTPGTAKIVRDKIAEIFPQEWENYIDEIAVKRMEWKQSGKTYDEVNQLTKLYVKERGWV
jgi:precorrin-2 dehydrogenase / sirohydrochlorin ferrochelatase